LLFVIGSWTGRRLGVLASLAAMTAIAFTRVFWIHGVVLNFEPLTALLIVVSLIFFADGFFRSDRPAETSIALGYLFWILGMFTDWPAYFLIVPLAWYFARQRRWLALASSAFLSVFCYSALMYFYGV